MAFEFLEDLGGSDRMDAQKTADISIGIALWHDLLPFFQDSPVQQKLRQGPSRTALLTGLEFAADQIIIGHRQRDQFFEQRRLTAQTLHDDICRDAVAEAVGLGDEAGDAGLIDKGHQNTDQRIDDAVISFDIMDRFQAVGRYSGTIAGALDDIICLLYTSDAADE